jgi:hypothetical protein
MQLAREISQSLGLGRHKVIGIIDKFTGDDPGTHWWNFTVGARGVKLYQLLGAPRLTQAF